MNGSSVSKVNSKNEGNHIHVNTTVQKNKLLIMYKGLFRGRDVLAIWCNQA